MVGHDSCPHPTESTILLGLALCVKPGAFRLAFGGSACWEAVTAATPKRTLTPGLAPNCRTNLSPLLHFHHSPCYNLEFSPTALQAGWRFRGLPASGPELVTSLSSAVYVVNNSSNATTGYHKLIQKCILLLAPLSAAAEHDPCRSLLAVVV